MYVRIYEGKSILYNLNRNMQVHTYIRTRVCKENKELEKMTAC